MHWTKFFMMISIVTVTLGGCASQSTILPASDRAMADIYREAMKEVPATPLEPHAEAVCEALDLNEPIDACQVIVEKYAAARYSVIDSQNTPYALDYLPYTREVHTELSQLFPRLSNPDLVIYVYPHLVTRTRAPIPGYSTAIPLYERVEYRLPGEDLLETPLPKKPVSPDAESSP